MRVYNSWTQQEDSFLVTHPELPARAISEQLGTRTQSAVTNRRKVLGIGSLKGRGGWSEEQLRILKDNQHISAEEVADLVGKRPVAIYAKRHTMKLPRVFLCEHCGTETPNQKWCDKHGKAAYTYKDYKSKCVKKGREIEIGQKEFIALLDEPCHYCGGEPSGLDRVDNAKDYLKDNVVASCKRCNVMKNDMELGDFKAHILKIAKRLGECNGK